MADIYRVTWPFEVVPGVRVSAIPRYADCLDEATAKQVQDGLKAIGYSQALYFGVSARPTPTISGPEQDSEPAAVAS